MLSICSFLHNQPTGEQPSNRQRKIRLFILVVRDVLIAVMVLAFLGGGTTRIVQAARLPVVETTGAGQEQTSQHSNNCLLCHGISNFTGILGDGVKINLTLDSESVKNNIHLRLGTCTICHKGFDGYPHANSKGVNCSQCHSDGGINTEINVTLPFENSRELTVSTNDRCYVCHQTEYVKFSDGMHAKILNSGNPSAPVCSDCHGSHSVQIVTKTVSTQSCSKCHEATYNSFMSSVHGAELEKKSTIDAPTCVDCHGSHTIDGPINPDFRKNVVSICLKCHQDKIMMNRYNLPADIFDTGIDNYHAVKAETVGQGDLNAAGNTPVCVDCHGVHSILSGTKSGSMVSSTNLLSTCLKCHSGEADFNVTGRAHLRSSSSAMIDVTFIEKFFGYFTPISVVMVVIYIVLDARKQRSEHKKHLEKTNE
jgi:hypothetical protein